MLSVTDNSRGRAVIPLHIGPSRQIARPMIRYSVVSYQKATGGAAALKFVSLVPNSLVSSVETDGC